MPSRPPVHSPFNRPRLADPRASAHARGYDRTWEKLRRAFLARHPLCARHQALDQLVPATEVHHVVPIETAPDRRLDWDNLEALCKPCHSAETARSQR